MTWVSHILQAIANAGLTSQDVRNRLNEARNDYTHRRNALCIALQALGINVASASDGLNVWVPLAKDAKDVAYALAQKGWLVRLGKAFEVQGQTQAIRVTISKLDSDQAQCFASDLKSCLASVP